MFITTSSDYIYYAPTTLIRQSMSSYNAQNTMFYIKNYEWA